MVEWIPAVAASTWASKLKTYVHNPPSATTTSTPTPGVRLNVTSQPHLAVKGTGHASAVLSSYAGRAQTHIVSLSNTKPSPAAADEHVTAQATRAHADLASIRAMHEAWWAAWWPAGGFLTLDHSPLEASLP